MLLADVVTGSAAVAATRSRLVKTAAIAGCLNRADDAEMGVVASYLAGTLPQGRIGTGWATVLSIPHTPAPQPSAGVLEVDAVLVELSAVHGPGATERRASLLAALFARLTDVEHDFLVRLLLGELRQGALQSLVLDGLAASAGVPVTDVRRAAMLSGSLAATARLTRSGGAAALRAVRLQVGRPVSPMLASPAGSLDDALRTLGAVRVEHKMDGARIQVHRDGDRVRVFTRGLRDITAGVGELVEVVRSFDCRTAVLDGESLALSDDGRPRPFQETMSRFGAEGPRELLLRPFFFDLLHLDGRDLLDEPLSLRCAALAALVGPHRMPGRDLPPAEAAAGARAVLVEALAAGHEGVVLKSLTSTYAAGRRGGSWQKLKPVHTLDLLVLAAEWGHGRRTGTLSNLHLGARDPGGGPPVMVGKTFKGLTDALLAWQTQTLPTLEVRRTPGTVWVRPVLVVEIAVDGVQVSSRYPGGVALRFARVLRYRPDKGPEAADTIQGVRAMLPTRRPVPQP